MKSRMLTIFSVTTLLVAGVAIAKEATAPKADLSKAKCMFSGKKCSEKAAVDHAGGKVHFCCEGCVAKFKKDSKKYAAKANLHLVATAQFKQKGCPISGGKTKDSTAVKVSGTAVTFCCNNCQKKVNDKTGDDQIDLVFNDKAFKKGFELAKKK